MPVGASRTNDPAGLGTVGRSGRRCDPSHSRVTVLGGARSTRHTEALAACCQTTRSLGKNICFRQSLALCCNEKLLEVSNARLNDALDAPAAIDRQRAALILVGRGSLDDSATAEMFRFSELRGERERFGVVRTAFIAMANPRLPDVIKQVAQLPDIDTVIVQPHLLFHGQLNAQVAETVADANNRYPDRTWLLTKHLGPDAAIARALIET